MIAGAHGVRGLVRLRSFTEDPEAIASYEPLTDAEGATTFKLALKSAAKDFYIAELKGVSSREQAEELRGTKLYVTRDLLPKTGKREYYEADLVGLAVLDRQGKDHGQIVAVHNYGGGPMLEIGASRKNGFMLPFNDAFVPEVDVKSGRVVIDPPSGWLDQDKPPVKNKRAGQEDEDA